MRDDQVVAHGDDRQVLQSDGAGFEGAGERPTVPVDDAVPVEHAHAGDIDEDGVLGEQGAETVSVAVVECVAERGD
jgi:hypothetical protein